MILERASLATPEHRELPEHREIRVPAQRGIRDPRELRGRRGIPELELPEILGLKVRRVLESLVLE